MFVKDFSGWIQYKEKLHNKQNRTPLFKERDVWWTSIGINVGFEEDGKHDKFLRPVLVIKKFNRDLFLGVPMSTKIKENKYYVKVTVKNNTVSVLMSQLRVFSANRLQDKLVELDKKDFRIVTDKIVNMIK